MLAEAEEGGSVGRQRGGELQVLVLENEGREGVKEDVAGGAAGDGEGEGGGGVEGEEKVGVRGGEDFASPRCRR